MNCKQTEKLLALYVGGDLATGKARSISAHLQSCEGCRRRVDEFAATRELMSAYVPPEFDAKFFEDVRRGVMSEIKREPPRSFFASNIARFFNRNALAYAASFAILVVAGTFVLRLRNDSTNVVNGPAHSIVISVDEQKDKGAPVGDVAGSEDKREDSPATAQNDLVEAQPHRPNGATLPGTLQAVHPKATRTHVKHGRDEGVAVATPFKEGTDLTTVGHIAPSETLLAEQKAGVIEERKMLRIELQTGDPNVRIIWLSPQSSESLPKR